MLQPTMDPLLGDDVGASLDPPDLADSGAVARENSDIVLINLPEQGK
jgi:hypothetical protein